MGSTIKTPSQWASALLGALGLPNTKTNVDNIVAWEAYEGGNWHNTAKFNPLNTTQSEPGSTVMPGGNKSGVQAYPSWQEGLDATVATLSAGDYGYPQILADLNTSQPWKTFAADVTKSGWGSKLTKVNQGSGTPSPQAYGAGATATEQSGSSADSPGSGTGKLTGIAGVLQSLDALYTPDFSTPNWNPVSFLTFVPNDIREVTVMVFVRGVSSILSLGMIFIGVHMLVGGGAGSSSGPTNVLEFVNNAQMSNQKSALSLERIKTQQQKEQDVAARHEQRMADNAANRETRERVANTPRVSHQYKHSIIEHKSSKPKVKVKWFPNPSK